MCLFYHLMRLPGPFQAQLSVLALNVLILSLDEAPWSLSSTIISALHLPCSNICRYSPANGALGFEGVHAPGSLHNQPQGGELAGSVTEQPFFIQVGRGPVKLVLQARGAQSAMISAVSAQQGILQPCHRPCSNTPHQLGLKAKRLRRAED